jgi:signal transduction histidine kinase
MGLRIEGELPSPVPRDEPSILDPLSTGEMKLARRHGGAGLELPIAAAWARRLGGRLAWTGEESAVGIELELPAVGRDPLGHLRVEDPG